MSTYSPSLRIELITTGDQAGTWGATTNTNLGTLIESAIAGYVSVSVISANQALTALNGAADEARQQMIALTTTTGANFAVYAPPAEKTYIIYNASAYTATIYNSTVIGNTTAAGTGVAIPAGKAGTVWTEGTNFRLQNTYLDTPTIASPTMTGTPVAPTASPGTSTTQVATTAFVAAATGGLGTMSTQNANNVAITGGSITGITDLAVADGGTGASTAANARTNLGTDDAANLTTGTVATARLATSGTASSSTYLRGDQTWASLPTSVSGAQGQVFTSNGTFTIPTSITAVKVTVIGGGGGGSGAGIAGSAYGNGGGTAIKWLTGLTPGNTLSVTIGAGGGGGGQVTHGSAGGASTVASGTQSISTITGNGGSASSSNAGGTASGGDLNIPGGAGLLGINGGISGSSLYGNGVRSNPGGAAVGTGYGSGGGKGSDADCTQAAGGAGSAGVVVFEY